MRFKGTVLSSALALSLLLGAGSAYAASDTGANISGRSVEYRVLTPYTQQFNWQTINWQYIFSRIQLPQQQQPSWTELPLEWVVPGSGNGAGAETGGRGGSATPGNGNASAPGYGDNDNGGSVPTAPGTPATPSTPPTSGNGQSGIVDTAYADQVVNLVNQERAAAGLAPLANDPALAKLALDKAKDMVINQYFDHQSPTYGSPFDMMRSYGISYSYAGENIAKGQRTPQEVMTAWMNSQGHRQNIMSPNFTKIGVGYYNGAWVQAFIAD